MPSQRMPWRKDPTTGGKGVKLTEKSNLLSPASHHLQVSLFSSLPQNVGLQLAEEAAVPEGGESCRLGGPKVELQGGRSWSGLWFSVSCISCRD